MEERKKMCPKRPTGAVPKVKYGNISSQVNHRSGNHNVSSNNLVHYDDGRDCYQSKLKFPSNPDILKRNCLQPYTIPMENNIDEHRATPKQNGIGYTSNGMTSSSTSASASRRNSTGTAPKSDNVTKYPDKKHIEDRLAKIREYLNATSCLISNMNHTNGQSSDENEAESLNQMYNDLKDSEAKLLTMLADVENHEAEIAKAEENGLENLDKAELERRYEQANKEVQILQEQELVLRNLQQAADIQMREARKAQEKLAIESRNETIQSRDAVLKNSKDVIKDLEGRYNMLAQCRFNEGPLQQAENIEAQIEMLQQNMGVLRDSNDNRNHLIQILDNRDSELRNEHMELQGRLMELQNKKSQVDKLVYELQSMHEDSEDDDVAPVQPQCMVQLCDLEDSAEVPNPKPEQCTQVRKIVNMKDQLAKLKDMLDAVKSTEAMIENQKVNENEENTQDNAHALPKKSDNLKRSANRSLSDSNAITRNDNQGNMSPNVRRPTEKQVNKSSIKEKEREKLKLQKELQAKKRELEELMYKHKAVSSNLNQDVHNENKSDHFNSQFEPDAEWRPAPNFQFSDSEECPEEDVNEYSEFNSSLDTNNTSLLQPMPALNYPTSNYTKHRDFDSHSVKSATSHHLTKTPERSIRSSSINTPVHHRERPTMNYEQDTQNKNQVQKKLELIRSVCDSMLSTNNAQQGNVQQLRNNLTPSPLYSEPRQFSTSNVQGHNALSTFNGVGEVPWIPPVVPNYAAADMTNYQNFLTTNTLQTQAFMLNTLNQCCQMMWLQQRELSALRNTVSLILERHPLEPNASPSYVNTPPGYNASASPSDPRSPPHLRPRSNSKSNQVSSASSLPNLSHMQVSHTNMDPACPNNMHGVRVVESNLNNTVVHNHQNEIGDHVNNMHNLNQAVPSQIWNGQALNNQVAPGNRANNYWDNFRSYSRQNLLSTKSNDGVQIASLENRSQNTLERSNSYTLPVPSLPKRNTEHHDSGNASIENTPRRRACFRTIRASSGETIDIVHNIPPDVLNVNETQKRNEEQEACLIPIGITNKENYHNTPHYPLHLHNCRNNTAYSPNMNLQQEQSGKDVHKCRQNRCWNSWQNNQDNQRNSPTNPAAELRENIYKEVSLLIAAHEERPQFLLHMFREIEKMTSDQLRYRALESLQYLVNRNEDMLDLQEESHNEFQDLIARLWPMSPKTCGNTANESAAGDVNYMLSEVSLFLTANTDEIFQCDFIDVIRDLLIQSRFSTIPRDEMAQRYFGSLLECAIGCHRGKMIKDVKPVIIKAVEDLLIMMDVKADLRDDQTVESSDEDENLAMNNLAAELGIDLGAHSIVPEDSKPQMPNGDLAEADQSRVEVDDEEEGAVGGVLNIFSERSPPKAQAAPDDVELPKIEHPIDTEIDTEFSEQGLDQVPTRLNAKTRARSSTPNKDRCSSRSDTSEQF